MLATLLANLHGMAYRCRNDQFWTMEFVSDGCLELTGYAAEDLLGNHKVSYEDIIHPEDRTRVRAEVGAALNAGGRFELTYRIVTAAGGLRWVNEHGLAILAGDGGPCVLEGIITDITARKVAEEALAENERILSAILNHSFQFTGLLDPTGRLLRANQTSLDAIGAARAEVEGRYFWETPWWQHSVVEQEQLRAAVRRAAGGGFVRYETSHPRADGGLMSVDFSLKPVRDEGGRVISIVAEGRDITDWKRAEQALRESEEKFAKAFRASPDAISISEAATGRFIEVNEGYERLSGYSRDELIGRTSHELGIWSNPADRERLIAELKVHGSVRDLEVVARVRHGRRCTFLMSAEPVDIGGRACLVLHSRDITDRKAAEQALRESEERFAKAFRASPDAISIVELETGRVLEVNEAVERIFGYSRAEVIGRTSLELQMWADPKEREHMVALLQREGRVRDLRLRGLARGGRPFVCLFSAEPIELNGRTCIVTVVKNITPQLEAERALRESEEKFAKAFDSSPYAQSISDLATGHFINVNEAFVQLSGYPYAEAVGHTALELGLWKRPAEREEILRRLAAGERVRHMQLTFFARDGREIVTLCSCERIEIGGRPGILTTIEDITGRREADELRTTLEAQLRQAQKLEALGQLAGGIAHDFNNILTGVLAFTELALIDLDRPAEVRKHLAEVSKAGNRARQLVRQILAFSRQQVQERVPVRLNAVVREAAELLRSSLPSTIQIDVHTDAQTPVVLADQIQIHQIIMNLGTNAAHAMRERPGALAIRLEPVRLDAAACAMARGLRPGLYACLSVADNGRGMDAATLKRIFEPFFTTKGPGEGTGLGLSVVHGIVEDHDAAITVRSQPGEGTIFRIFLPQHATLAQAVAAEPAALPRGRGEHILFLDDERMITDSVRVLLGHLGYRVTPHTDPQAALAAFQADPSAFSLVVTDLTMPHITGIEVARQILAVRPELPVLLASGYSGTWTPESLRALGLRGLIAKPLSSAGLAAAVRQALDEPSQG